MIVCAHRHVFPNPTLVPCIMPLYATCMHVCGSRVRSIKGPWVVPPLAVVPPSFCLFPLGPCWCELAVALPPPAIILAMWAV